VLDFNCLLCLFFGAVRGLLWEVPSSLVLHVGQPPDWLGEAWGIWDELGRENPESVRVQ